MGLPMAALAFGAAGLEIATLLFVIGVVLNATAAVTIGAHALGKHTARGAFLAPLRYPTFYAALVGIALNLLDADVPTVVWEPLTTLAAAAIPCMLVVLGLSFQMPRFYDVTDSLAVSVNRLVIGPLAAWGLTAALGLQRHDGCGRDHDGRHARGGEHDHPRRPARREHAPRRERGGHLDPALGGDPRGAPHPADLSGT